MPDRTEGCPIGTNDTSPPSLRRFRALLDGRPVATFSEAEGLSPWDRIKASASTMRDRVESRLRAGTPEKMEASGRIVRLTTGTVTDEEFDLWARGERDEGARDLEIEVLGEDGVRTAAHTVFEANVVRYVAGRWRPGTGSSVRKLELSCSGWDWSPGEDALKPGAPGERSSCRRAALAGGLVGGGIVALIGALIAVLVTSGTDPLRPASHEGEPASHEGEIIALDDQLVTEFGKRATVDVLRNDRPSGGDLRVVSVARPASGTAEVIGRGRVAYTPNDGFAGLDSFHYTVAADAERATATVLVEVRPRTVEPSVQAVLEASPREGDVPLVVRFDGSRSAATGSTIASFELRFGDGTSEAGTGRPEGFIEHTYPAAGTYTVRLIVTTDLGASAEDSLTIVAREPAVPNIAPVAVLSAEPVQGYAPLEVFFDTMGTEDTDGKIFSWDLAFGDGTSTGGVGFPPSSISHTYEEGTFTAVLTVADDVGATAADAVEVFVSDFG